MISQIIIERFLKNFNYVNIQGRRNGFLLFNNSALTHDLEKIAADLKKSLNTLLQDQKEDRAKCEEFAALINDAFVKCEKARADRKEWSHYFQSEYVGHHREGDYAYVSYDYKTPYAPAKFERELQTGLNAVINELSHQRREGDEDYLRLIVNYRHLAHKIRDFYPQEMRKNVDSFCP